MILINNSESAYDATARNTISLFLKNLKKSDVKAFQRYLKKHRQTEQDFDTVFFVDQDYKPLFRETVEEAYTDALEVDCEDPSFIRIWTVNGATHVIAAVECSLFAGLNPDDHRDREGWLRQELKDLAIAEIKKGLNI